jgi:hypothetical protein
MCVATFVIFAYLENGRLETTVSLQQVLFQSDKKCYSNVLNV